MTVPAATDEFPEQESRDFLDSLSEAVDDSFNASALPPKGGRRQTSNKSKPGRTSGVSRVSEFGPAEYVFAACLILGLLLSLLILNHNAGFFGFFVFFGGICLAAAFSKTDPQNRWSVPAVGVIAGYAIMMLFAAVVSRNAAVAVDLILMGLGLIVFANSPGLLGFSILAGLFLLQLLYFAGALGALDVVIMDQRFRRCHLLATATCMIYLVSGYLYHVWTTRVSHSA